MTGIEQMGRWIGAGARDALGDRVGRRDHVHADELTRRVAHDALQVRRSLFGHRSARVPHDEAHADADAVTVAHSHDGLERRAGSRHGDGVEGPQRKVIEAPDLGDWRPATGLGDLGVRAGAPPRILSS